MSAHKCHSVSRAMLAAGFGIAILAGAEATRAAELPPVLQTSDNLVPQCVTPNRLMAFLQTRNQRLSRRYRDIARAYADIGGRIGVRWDVSFLQMMVETANLTFRRPDGRPGDVAPQHNNFAGLGAIGDGRSGEIFPSMEAGVQAHLEHVLHYAGHSIPQPIAERTRKVQLWRVLENWHRGFERPITYNDLALRWAPHTRAYLDSITQLGRKFQDRFCGGRAALVRSGPRAPMVAKTAWRLEKAPELAVRSSVSAAPKKAPVAWTMLNASRNPPSALGAAPLPALPVAAPPSMRYATALPRSVPAAPASVPRRYAAAHPASVSSRSQAEHNNEPQRRVPRRRISENDRVRQMVSDRKVLLRTQIGTEVPIIYRSNGFMSGDANGLSFFLGSARDHGRWWVSKGKLCQKWKVWLDRETHCMSLKQRGGTVWWKSDDGKSGTARIVSR